MTIHEGVAVHELVKKRGSWSVTKTPARFQASEVVIAAGVWTRSLLQPLGYRLPLEAAKGYSITSRGEGTRPHHAIYLLEAKVGCSPYADVWTIPLLVDGSVRFSV